MQRKNFYLTDDIVSDVKFASKLHNVKEAEIVRKILRKNIASCFPNGGTLQAGPRSKFTNMILDRANHGCENCHKKVNDTRVGSGGVVYSSKKVTRRMLDIHHKDQNKNNNRPSNLILLCKSCHRIRHAKLNGRRQSKKV